MSNQVRGEPTCWGILETGPCLLLLKLIPIGWNKVNMWGPGNTEKLCPLSVPDSRRKQSLERRNIIRGHHGAFWTLSFEAPVASEWCSKAAETSLPNKGHRREWRLQNGPHATEQRAAPAPGGPHLSGGEQLSLLKSGKNVVLPANPRYPHAFLLAGVIVRGQCDFFLYPQASFWLPCISWVSLSPVCKLGTNTLLLNTGFTCAWPVLLAEGLRRYFGEWLFLTSWRSRSGLFSNLQALRAIKINLQEILCMPLLIQKMALASKLMLIWCFSCPQCMRVLHVESLGVPTYADM